MRQLLYQYENYILVGLKDRAFLVSTAKTSSSNDNNILELKSTTSTSTTNNNNNNNKNTDDNDDDDDYLNDITAVAMTSYEKYHYCVVARYNKTLSVYKISKESTTMGEDNDEPPYYILYHAPKRISCLQFTTLPSSDTTDSVMIPVLIVGDLAGDAYAYNITHKMEKRLLLGHTASMLTGLVILHQEQDNDETTTTTKSHHRYHYIATSDRDEKIRISRFPKSYIVEGYCLGHTNFVTGIAPVPSLSSSLSPSTLLISCGGDKMLRLWDWKNQKELCNVELQQQQDQESEYYIPSDIDVNNNGQIVAVTYDESTLISFYKIIGNEKSKDTMSYSLTFMGCMDCPSKPLNITFDKSNNTNNDDVLLVLLDGSEYINAYRITQKKVDDDHQETIVATRIDNDEGFGKCLQAVKDIAAKENISMPNSILEKDKHGILVLQKENETRGPSAANAPWNRVERVDNHKSKEKKRQRKRSKKRRTGDQGESVASDDDDDEEKEISTNNE